MCWSLTAFDLISKQSNLKLDKRMVAEVLCLYVVAVLTVCAGPSVLSDVVSKQSNLEPNEWLQMYFCMIVSACGCDLALLPCAC